MSKNTPGESQTFEQRVNEVVEKFTTDEKGEAQLPADLQVDEAVLFAAKTEKRRRDTQSAFTKAQQKAKELEVEKGEILNKYQELAVKALSAADQEELEALKHSDPDAWRTKINELEEKSRKRVADEIDGIGKKAKAESEIERRTRLLEEHNKANPKAVLNDEVIENDIPPRFTKQLEKGEITFEEFLTKCGEYLTTGKVVKQAPDPKTGKTLDDVGGGSTPPESAIRKESKSTYKNETF